MHIIISNLEKYLWGFNLNLMFKIEADENIQSVCYNWNVLLSSLSLWETFKSDSFSVIN